MAAPAVLSGDHCDQGQWTRWILWVFGVDVSVMWPACRCQEQGVSIGVLFLLKRSAFNVVAKQLYMLSTEGFSLYLFYNLTAFLKKIIRHKKHLLRNGTFDLF